jgi:hypothetical protein
MQALIFSWLFSALASQRSHVRVGASIDVQDGEGNSSLHLASLLMSLLALNVVRELVNAEANVHLRTRSEYYHQCCCWGVYCSVTLASSAHLASALPALYSPCLLLTLLLPEPGSRPWTSPSRVGSAGRCACSKKVLHSPFLSQCTELNM